MTYQGDFALPTELLEQIASESFDILSELICPLINTAMQAERQQHLGETDPVLRRVLESRCC